jgi:hypothetical protein
MKLFDIVLLLVAMSAPPIIIFKWFLNEIERIETKDDNN